MAQVEHHVRRAATARVLDASAAQVGAVRLDFQEKLFRRNYREPVLISATHGVGGQARLASRVGVYDTLGRDCVAASVNELVSRGAEPLFFQYRLMAVERQTTAVATILAGVADGCLDAGCALLGGEAAAAPDGFPEGVVDLVGFAVGVGEMSRLVDGRLGGVGRGTEAGDVILGLACEGINRGGLDSALEIVGRAGLDFNRIYPDLDEARSLGRVLLTPEHIYSKPIMAVLGHYRVKHVVGGMTPVAGSGLIGSLAHVLGERLDARLTSGSWSKPAVFSFLQRHSGLSDPQMAETFNLGLGYCLIVRPAFADSIAAQLRRQGETPSIIGKVAKGSGKVVIE